GDYHLAGFAGPEESMRRLFERRRAKGDLFSGVVVESGRSEVFKDLQSEEKFLHFKEVALQKVRLSSEEESYWKIVRSAYIVPISTGLYGKQVDAVLNVSSSSVAFFDAEKQDSVDEFVALAALTITRN